MIKIHTEKAPAAVGPYSQAIVSGGMVYTSGQIAIDPVTGTIASDDITGQTEQIMRNLGDHTHYRRCDTERSAIRTTNEYFARSRLFSG